MTLPSSFSLEQESMADEQSMENTYDHDDEAEETLSLCDYYTIDILSVSAEGEDCSTQILKSTSSSCSDQEHYFEFCSEEWSNSIVSCESENIIFCGKIITCDEPTSQINFQNLRIIKETRHDDEEPAESFRWDGSHNNNNNNRRKEEMFMKKEDQKLRKLSAGKSTNRMSVLTSIGKMRWSLFLFGGKKFPTEMVWRDIKNRQSRLNPSSTTLFRLENVVDDDHKMIISNRSEDRSHQRLWRLIKAISCGGQKHANTVVKASIGCIPRL